MYTAHTYFVDLYVKGINLPMHEIYLAHMYTMLSTHPCICCKMVLSAKRMTRRCLQINQIALKQHSSGKKQKIYVLVRMLGFMIDKEDVLRQAW